MSAELQHNRYFAEEILSTEENKSCLLRGWVEDIRPLGKIAFFTIRDTTGLAQVVINKNVVGEETFNLAMSVSRQSIIEVDGKVKKSRSENIPKEVLAEKFRVLSRSNPPFPIDPTGRVFSSLDKRLDARALDLRNPRTAAIFKIRDTLLKSIRKTFADLKFIEVNTPKLIGQAAEGGADLFTLPYFGRKAYLAQSPQLYKEQLTISLERVFEMAQFFRAEKSHTLRHVCEFMSLDMESAYIDEFDAMFIAEEIVRNSIEDVRKEDTDRLNILGTKLPDISRPFKRLTYSDAIDTLKDKSRLEFGDDLETRDLRKLGRIYKGFYFIYDWPVSIKPFYIEKRDSKISKSFDLMHGYLELASGGKRVNDKDELKRRLQEQGLDLKEFESHINSFDFGMPPHSGWGLGVDRLLMVITGQKNIRETIFYPRDTNRLTP